MNPTQLQSAIIEATINGNENLIIDSAPGSGKTASIKFLTDEYLVKYPGAEILCLAYTNSIKDALSEKLDKRCKILSIHQLGYSILKASGLQKRFKWNPVLHDKKTGNLDMKYRTILTDIILPDFEPSQYKDAFRIISNVFELLNKCRIEMVDFDNCEAVRAIAEKYKVANFEEHYCECMKEAKEIGQRQFIENGWVSFLDMIALAVEMDIPIRKPFLVGNAKYNSTFRDLSLLIVDEVQDSSPLNFRMIQKVINSFVGARFIGVGDPKQSLFGFTGAMSTSMNFATNLFNCHILNLSETFRCPISHVDYINDRFGTNIVSKRENAGTINNITEEGLIDIVRPGDYVLARKNQELMLMFLHLLQNNIPAILQKFDLYGFFEDLLGEIESKNKKLWDDFHVNIFMYLQEESDKYRKKLGKYRAEEIIGDLELNIGVLSAYVEFTGAGSTKQFLYKIQGILDKTNKYNAVYLYNFHLSKGLESDNVFILNYDKLPLVRDGMSEEDEQQELNCLYVALSRSKENLYLVQQTSE